ncbi:uncharacterized protein [Dipodomys merriami]|uniref:uncharacterized protein isoform X3 n=1 Tax=Dipodomys merriami TaxID=94247 RepID=UPI003855C3A6
MGQRLTTPLSLTLDHWTEVVTRARNLSLEVQKKKWISFCSSEWPTLNVGWPKEGSFNLDILLQALLTTEERQRVFLEARKNVPGEDGRPTQLPNEIDEVFPLTRPNWDFNIAADVQEMEEVIKTCQEGPDECLCEVAVTKSNPVEERVRLITCLSQHYYHS